MQFKSVFKFWTFYYSQYLGVNMATWPCVSLSKIITHTHTHRKNNTLCRISASKWTIRDKPRHVLVSAPLPSHQWLSIKCDMNPQIVGRLQSFCRAAAALHSCPGMQLVKDAAELVKTHHEIRTGEKKETCGAYSLFIKNLVAGNILRYMPQTCLLMT